MRQDLVRQGPHASEAGVPEVHGVDAVLDVERDIRVRLRRQQVAVGPVDKGGVRVDQGKLEIQDGIHGRIGAQELSGDRQLRGFGASQQGQKREGKGRPEDGDLAGGAIRRPCRMQWSAHGLSQKRKLKPEDRRALAADSDIGKPPSM
ncbi:MAG: hypothetical protein HQL31_13100 [Planctomycetes bacterium]|nr:hypothetical protein [Planctomycetota bacterium]